MDMPISLSASVFEYTGETHDKNVIYMTATLYVPRGKKAMYQMTEGWKNFLNVVETDTKFKLKYYVDGQEYKTYEIQATEVVTPEPDPYKEGYIFSVWSTIPYLMPAQDVVVTGSFTADPEFSAVESVTKDKATPQACYTPDGRRHVTQQRGLNIIHMSDGTTKKVLVR